MQQQPMLLEDNTMYGGINQVGTQLDFLKKKII